ncbi:MAG TPA: hypothetical protein VEK08_00410 [Planctomycetota bacterium]|nr:hypothetical protein [Planctomycetota bacterium]
MKSRQKAPEPLISPSERAELIAKLKQKAFSGDPVSVFALLTLCRNKPLSLASFPNIDC